MTAKLPRMAFLAALLGFALLGAQSECQSEAELWRSASSSQDRGTVQWTPDGSKIIFSGGGRIVVADASGTEFYTIPQGPAANPPFLQDGPARISPDGSKLAYVTYRYLKGISRTHSNEIATSNLDGSDPRRLTSDHYDYRQPAWSPDGSQIAFASWGSSRAKDEGRDGIFVVDSDGGSDPRLVGPPTYPDLPNKYSWYVSSPVWSPNGEFIVFLELVYTDGWHGYIAAIKPDGSGYRRIHDNSPPGSYVIESPRFSPDGRRLVFVMSQDETSVIKTVNFDGSDQRTLLTVPTTDATRGDPPPRTGPYGPIQYINHVTWSPDGSEIFFSGFSESSDHPQSLVTGIHAIGVDGTGPRTISQFNMLRHIWPVALSPDGSRFAVLSTPYDLVPSTTGGVRHPDDGWYPKRYDEEGGDILFTIAADGSDKRVLIKETGEVFIPQHPNRKAGSEDPVTCSTGKAIQEPEKRQELVRDCETLLAIRDALTGEDGFLNWNPARSMDAWHGISIGGSPLRVEKVDLWLTADDIIYGVLPPGIGDLDGLKKLIIDQPLTGPIPPSLGNLTNLEYLHVVNTLGNGFALSGEIPPELGNMTNLTTLVFSGDFTGNMPEELGNLERLKSLVILGSKLTGCIPSAITSKPDLNIQIKGLPPC